MGFKRPVYELTFDGPLAGLEVRTKGATVGEMVELRSLAETAQLLSTEDASERDRMIEIIGSKLISWNLTDDQDEPVPCTAEQLVKEDWTITISIVRGWLNMGVSVGRPLAPPSDGGQPSEAPSMPMETL